MKITVIYGTERKKISTTYNLVQAAINALKEDDDVYEFFLPKDMNHFCRGCYSCFEGKPERCGGYENIKVIQEAMDKSEIIIFSAPVYVFHIPGQLKVLLDHFGYRWMVHRPNGKMFTFYGCRFMHKNIGLNEVDTVYWKQQGWLDKVRPWK